MNALEKCIEQYKNSGFVEHVAVRVGIGDEVLLESYLNTDSKTLFDMASVTKVVVTTMLTLIALEDAKLSLGEDMRWFRLGSNPVTVKHLLTHTMGFGHKPLNIEGNTYDNVQEYILNIPPEVALGKEVRYSCPGFILLGKILEMRLGMRLDDAFKKYVADPIGMTSSSFGPVSGDVVNANNDEAMRGVVNDYNCRFLGGVAGNAGLFSNIEDLTKYVKMLLNGGAPILRSPLTLKNATTCHTKGLNESRGLGFVVTDDRYFQTGRLFKNGSFGHGGHTGQTVFVDPDSGLYAIILSDATRHSTKYDEVKQFRMTMHNAIADSL